MTYQVIKDISLMDVNGDEGLKLCPLIFGEILSGHIDQQVQDIQEVLVGIGHDLEESWNNTTWTWSAHRYQDLTESREYYSDMGILHGRE